MEISHCEFYSIALDESTDISDTTQLSVLIRGVTNNFKVIVEFLEMCLGNNNRATYCCKGLWEIQIDPKKLCGITTD